MEEQFIKPTERGQVTIPKEMREKLQINQNTRLRVYVDGNKVVLEPVSPLDLIFKELEVEAREKGFTRQELDKEIAMVRERLMKELYSEGQ
ncbi:AbrB/MazE/SpoVT family DNA-binding domain-containing protein [Neomoorella thermoacetica]|uniref:SpoVT / AbrB like domain protein n=1 Tax=Neomoorella thermoacetica TaxID=1525 RepID=A0A1J5NTR5_NEOTH|nr:AbrB/MazE/SpoVT family DNA-binding domain-containing protein [Moorella thermoacetica]APC07761.1 SpoVT / AbrB like domain protein [Moorella thermoacetica]OIQ53534.1 SpoVT / AbrB like domain protein [Moorella thermoacetica]OIQ61608.1 SpoVT / AbrB like domain protein [Moorella thermoacetica]